MGADVTDGPGVNASIIPFMQRGKQTGEISKTPTSNT
jgi:hypothetical protein